MIQRVQTLFLLAIPGLIAGFLLLPVAVFHGTGAQFLVLTLQNSHSEQVRILANFQFLVVHVLAWALGIFSLVIIFLFKRRKIQMMLCKWMAILLLVLDLFTFLLIRTLQHAMGGTVTFKPALIFPAIAILFCYLAFRRIHKDDQLVKSYDRLR